MGRIAVTTGLRVGQSLGWKIIKNNFPKESYLDEIAFCNFITTLLTSERSLGSKEVSNRLLKKGILGQVDLHYSRELLKVNIEIYEPYSLHNLSEPHILLLGRHIQECGVRCFKLPLQVKFSICLGGKDGYISPDILLTYLTVKLNKGFTLGEVLGSSMRVLKQLNYLKGYRLHFSGRFNRRQRASFRRIQGGQLPFSSCSAPIEYAVGKVVLKYGVGGIKVWLNWSPSVEKYQKQLVIFPTSGSTYF